MLLGEAPCSRRRCQDPHLWTPAYGQRYEESHRVARIRQGTTRQQAGGPSFLLLDAHHVTKVAQNHGGVGRHHRITYKNSIYWLPLTTAVE